VPGIKLTRGNETIMAWADKEYAVSADSMMPMSQVTSAKPAELRGFALFNIIAGAVGWFASFQLLTEYVKTLQNPEYVPNCSVSLLVTCGPNMESWQGSLFGFSNTIIGVAAFVAPVAVGVAILAGARFSSWFWWAYQVGLLCGFAFILWLSYQSFFSLGTLCPWCMVVWLVMIPLFWIGVLRPQSAGMLSVSEPGRKLYENLYSWSWVCIVLTYLFIAVVAQVQLDWFGEFRRL
jgi:uncharacterized membrane protein